MVKFLFFVLCFISCKNLGSVIGAQGNSATNSATSIQYDGPYVQYLGNQVLVNYIIENNGKKKVKKEKVSSKKKAELLLRVMTDVPEQSFNVVLKKNLANEESEYPLPEKVLVVSDIEGNFEAFRKLLQANKVIDEDLKWKFDKGHLVLIGDFFDRGQQVTELLWLIYSLEEKAKDSGGYVHFILGNHEIMNLSNDLRYLNKKYLDNALLLNQPYPSLYGEDTELGRWLRTKNVVEKIGDLLITHGGISPDVNKMNASIADINKLARPYYGGTVDYIDPKTDLLFSDVGPFWYRGYYDKNNSTATTQIDSTRALYNINQIITGHSIVADTVSIWYGGKLLNTDVPHASGKSEALLIEKQKFFRVNTDGEKFLIMDISKK